MTKKNDQGKINITTTMPLIIQKAEQYTEHGIEYFEFSYVNKVPRTNTYHSVLRRDVPRDIKKIDRSTLLLLARIVGIPVTTYIKKAALAELVAPLIIFC